MTNIEPGSTILNWAVVFMSLLLLTQAIQVIQKQTQHELCSCAAVMENNAKETVDYSLLQVMRAAAGSTCTVPVGVLEQYDINASAIGINVEIITENLEDVPFFIEKIKGMDGSVISSFENTIYAAAPLSVLCQLVGEEAVYYIALSREMKMLQKGVQ